MSALHDWHRHVFQKRTKVTVTWPARSTIFGGNFPEETREVTHLTARTVIAQRAVNSMTPAEWASAQEAFDASPEGGELKDEDAGVRREHCELWLLHRLHTDDHESMVAPTEFAINMVMDHHATPSKVHAHKKRHLHPERLAKPSPAVLVPESPEHVDALTPNMVRGMGVKAVLS